MMRRWAWLGWLPWWAMGQDFRGPEVDPPVHDPSVVVREGGHLWSFATGTGIAVLKREGEGRWRREGVVVEEVPRWHRDEVPENRGHLWAPEVIRVGDEWFLYYSVSTFGSNRSAIGLATRRAIDPRDGGAGWKDRGVVIRSRREDRFNAIDPAVFREGGRMWMTYGSFWDGIFLIELDPRTGLRKQGDGVPRRLAFAPEIEAPFLCRQGEWYYLFVNWGKCCQGVKSTYEIRVGRSRKVEGPYLDREGVDLVRGGGTLVLGSEGRYIGPGHASIYGEGGREWLMHHFYDAERGGRATARMLGLVWKEGWPEVGREEFTTSSRGRE